MQETEDTVLFGKYQITGTLGTGRNGTVLLAVHLGLREYRAIKRVRKEQRPGVFLREAEILKSLRDPGIPVIYDLEEDQNYFYIIEEYLEGHSLSALMKERGSLTRAEIAAYGSELCRILVYLHSLKPNPILHLDLQPKNLMICGGALKLIDFDQAVFSAGNEGRALRFGTPGFAAPELYRNEAPDERADIYAIGALLFYMGTGRSPEGENCVENAGFDGRLEAVIEQCLSPQKEKRFQTAKELSEALGALRTGVFTENQMPLLTIAVAGSRPGTGTTLAALALSAFLNLHAGPCLYEERNSSGAAASLGRAMGKRPDRRGIFQAGIVPVKPLFGKNVHPDENSFRIRVLDMGALDSQNLKGISREDHEAFQVQLFLLVCGGRPWELSDCRRAAGKLFRESQTSQEPWESQKARIKILVNRRESAGNILLPEEARDCAAGFLPWIEDPISGEEETATEAFYSLLSGTEAAKWLLKREQKGRKHRIRGLLRLIKGQNRR